MNTPHPLRPKGCERFCIQCGGRLVLRRRGGALRPVCLRCGWIYFKNPASASAVAIITGGRVVLVKRRLPPKAGSWCLPAGFQEYDESPEQTAVREAKEETNLEVRLMGLCAVFFTSAPPGKNTVVHVYLAERTGGRMRPGDDAVAVRSFPLDRLPARIAFRSQVEILERFAAGGARPGRPSRLSAVGRRG